MLRNKFIPLKKLHSSFQMCDSILESDPTLKSSNVMLEKITVVILEQVLTFCKEIILPKDKDRLIEDAGL